MTKYQLEHTTNKGSQNLHVITNSISIENLLLCADEEKIRNLCQIGCVNYERKWSCPPFSSQISDIIKTGNFDNAFIITGYIFLSDMNYIKNPYQKVKAANMILKSKCEEYARKVENLTQGYALLSGSCNLCKPCCKKLNMPCKKPEKRRYSLESTGINVSLLSSKFCNHELLWYNKGEDLLYTSVVTAILYKGDFPFDLLTSFINSSEK